MYPTLFGTVSGFEARVYGRPPVELSDQWIDIRSDLPLNGSETAFAVIRRRVDGKTLTWIGCYRAAHELSVSRGGHCGAGIWLVDRVASGALLADLLQRLVAELSARALENGKFVRTLSAIEPQMNWHEELGKQVKASLQPYQAGGLQGADLPAVLLDASGNASSQLPLLIDAAQVGAGLRAYCRAVVTADARVSRAIEASDSMKVHTPESLILAGGIVQAEAAVAAAEARRQLELTQQAMRAEWEAGQQQAQQELARGRQQIQDLSDRLQQAGLERDQLRDSLAAAEDQAAHARGEVTTLLRQGDRLRQLLDEAERIKEQYAAECRRLRNSIAPTQVPISAGYAAPTQLPISTGYAAAAPWQSGAAPASASRPPLGPHASPPPQAGPAKPSRPPEPQPPDNMMLAAGPPRPSGDWTNPSPARSQGGRSRSARGGALRMARWQVFGLLALLVGAIIWAAGRPGQPTMEPVAEQRPTADQVLLRCEEGWTRGTRSVSFSIPSGAQDAQRLASLVWRVECGGEDRWSCKNGDVQRLSSALQAQLTGIGIASRTEPTQFIQVTVPRACKGERDGQWALIGPAIDPTALAPVRVRSEPPAPAVEQRRVAGANASTASKPAVKPADKAQAASPATPAKPKTPPANNKQAGANAATGNGAAGPPSPPAQSAPGSPDSDSSRGRAQETAQPPAEKDTGPN